MALQLAPQWDGVWQGGCPDVEKDILLPLFTPQFANVNVVSWIPKPDVYLAQLEAGRGYLRIYRTGGAWNDNENRDEPRVQFAALMPSRNDSWDLINFTREVLHQFIRETSVVPGTAHKLAAEGEIAGPQLIPELLQDDKLVPITFQLFTWKPKGLPDYRAALNLNTI